MKKIIGGKKYDAQTAEHLAYYDNGRYPNDFRWFEETLYRTAKGAISYMEREAR